MNEINDVADWWFTDERIDAEEAAEIVGVSLATFYQYRCNGILVVPTYGYGHKKYFKRSEVKAAAIKRIRYAGIG